MDYGLVVATLLLVTGCAHVPLSPGYPGARALPAPTASYYHEPAEIPRATTTELLETRPHFRVFRVQFPLQVETFQPTEPTVTLEWFESVQPGRRPTILFLPILGGDYPLERGFCRFFARHGFHVALVHRKTLKISPEHGTDRLEFLLRQAIIRNRQVVDWLLTQERVDPERLGSFGISMGGMAGVITAAVEPRLKCHVIALAGGSLADILRDSRDSLLTKPRTRYLRAHQMDLQTMHDRLQEELRTDPLSLAPFVDARRVFMIIALFDRTVGRRQSIRLWNALGKPEAVFLPFGHYTAYLCIPYLKYRSLKFFRRCLGLSEP